VIGVPHVETNGVCTHYKRTSVAAAQDGGAPTAVFVHGLGTDSLASFYLTLAAPLAAAGVEVIAYDLRGHGRSDRPRSGYQVDDFVADLDGLLTELTVTSPVYLVGNSFGGTVAYAYAYRHPERVAGLVTIEAEPPTEVWAEKMNRLMGFTMALLDREDTFAWILANRGSHHARLARLAGERMRATDMVVQIPSGPMLTAEDLQQITCPVLNIIGDNGCQSEDPYFLQSLLPDCSTVVIEDQDHSVLVEAHRTVRRLVLDWVHGRRDVAVPASDGATSR
jgi:3-oxoadipate enol-lactonase